MSDLQVDIDTQKVISSAVAIPDSPSPIVLIAPSKETAVKTSSVNAVESMKAADRVSSKPKRGYPGIR